MPESIIKIRRHRLSDISRQVQQGEPDALPAYIPKHFREANSKAVNSIIDGAEIEVLDNQPDFFCDGCGKFDDCDYQD